MRPLEQSPGAREPVTEEIFFDGGTDCTSQGAAVLLPPALVGRARVIYRRRRHRDRLFEQGLFRDPAWDILLDLFIARADGRRICISSGCIASTAPHTTALRHMNAMVACGLLRRVPNHGDRRSWFVELTEQAVAAMVDYLEWEVQGETSSSREAPAGSCPLCMRRA